MYWTTLSERSIMSWSKKAGAMAAAVGGIAGREIRAWFAHSRRERNLDGEGKSDGI
jgi:hypothetical protein